MPLPHTTELAKAAAGVTAYDTALHDHHIALNALEVQVSDLRKRLNVVLEPEPPPEESAVKENAEPLGAPLISRLRALTRAVHKVSNMLQDIDTRLVL